MDLLDAVRDVGVSDPAMNADGRDRARKGLTRELSRPAVSGTGRRRPRRRLRLALPAAAGAAAAAAAVVVVASVGSGSRTVPSQVGHPAVVAHNAAYVVQHVKAELISLDHSSGVVTSSVDYVGSPIYHDFAYINPRTGALYQADRAETRGGAVLFEDVDESVPVRGDEHSVTFSIDYTRHTWSSGSSTDDVPIQTSSRPLFKHPLAGARSTPAAVQRALSSHLERQVGTTVIDGTRALVLTGTVGIDHITLDVDARTYQPLRETERGHDAEADINQVIEVLPATAANIALASRRPRVPAGYTFVAP